MIARYRRGSVHANRPLPMAGGLASEYLSDVMKNNPLTHRRGIPPPPTHEQIAALAHEIWHERGSPEGSDVDIWLEAERQLKGAPPTRPIADEIPADPDRVGTDDDPALNPSTDREIREIGGPLEQRSPTALNL